MAERDIFADDLKTTPYWWEAAAPTEEGSAEVPDRTDVAVIGSGYAGLSTALEWARNGTEVTVFEAVAFGQGASTRSGGQVSGLNVGKGAAGGAKSPVEKALGEERMRQILAGGSEALTTLEAVMEREGIDCSYRKSGRFVGAYTPAHYEVMRQKVEQLNAAGDAGAEMLPRERQREEIGSDFFFGGTKYERSGQVHPSLLQRGLLDACRRHGVRLCAQAPVTGIQRDGEGFVLTTGRGKLQARELVVATNAYTGRVTPWLRRRLIPAASYIIATEELPRDLVDELVPNRRGLADSKRVLNYFRVSPDDTRILFGGRAHFSMTDPRKAAPFLYRQMTDVFPQLRGRKITHCWTGGVAFTFDFLPHMGTRDGMHYLMGCNGSGVVMMTYLGTQTAMKMLGRANRPCPFDDLPFPTQPFYGGDPWFLPIVAGWFAIRDRIDRARAP
jgi:glycine/D-amino acid oxidase-like deaminating enzyme